MTQGGFVKLFVAKEMQRFFLKGNANATHLHKAVLKTKEQITSIAVGIRLIKTFRANTALFNRFHHPLLPTKSSRVSILGNASKFTMMPITNKTVDKIRIKFLAKKDLKGVEKTPFTLLPNLPSSKYIPKKWTDLLL